jgi:hypothetical protein
LYQKGLSDRKANHPVVQFLLPQDTITWYNNSLPPPPPAATFDALDLIPWLTDNDIGNDNNDNEDDNNNNDDVMFWGNNNVGALALGVARQHLRQGSHIGGAMALSGHWMVLAHCCWRREERQT